jgi:hypothetical protein
MGKTSKLKSAPGWTNLLNGTVAGTRTLDAVGRILRDFPRTEADARGQFAWARAARFVAEIACVKLIARNRVFVELHKFQHSFKSSN